MSLLFYTIGFSLYGSRSQGRNESAETIIGLKHSYNGAFIPYIHQTLPFFSTLVFLFRHSRFRRSGPARFVYSTTLKSIEQVSHFLLKNWWCCSSILVRPILTNLAMFQIQTQSRFKCPLSNLLTVQLHWTKTNIGLFKWNKIDKSFHRQIIICSKGKRKLINFHSIFDFLLSE